MELKHQGNIAFKLLVMSRKKALSLDDVMAFQLTPIPYCLGTPDGFMNKTNKATGLKTLTIGVDDSGQPPQTETLLVVDGNALYHCIKDIPDTLKGVAEKIFTMIPGTSDVIFSTDTYDKKSIK